MSGAKSDAPDGIALLARIFMDAAIRQVEAEIEAKEKANASAAEHDKPSEQLRGK